MLKKNVTVMLCPICRTELHITNQREFKCKCLNKLIVLGKGKDRQLVKLEDAPAVKKAMQVRCRDCINCRDGGCLDNDKPKIKTDMDCARICKRFRKNRRKI